MKTKDIQARINSGRKAEIRRITEQLWIHDSNNLFKTFADTIKCARNIVDNFDTEFERLERSDKLMHYTEINSEREK